MLNVKHTLDRMGFNSTCYTQAVQQVRERLETDGIHLAGTLVFEILGIHATFESEDQALLVVQAVVEDAIKHDGVAGNDPEEALAIAKKRVHEFMTKPANKWMFAKPEGYSATHIVETKQIGGVDTEVAVTAEGKFKKGEKEKHAITLYKTFTESNPLAADPQKANQAFIAILQKELGMSKAGATTYNYNMKKKLGGTIVAKPKRAK